MSILKKISFLFIISLTLMIIIVFLADNINATRMDNVIKNKYLAKVIEDIFKNIENESYINKLCFENDLEEIKNFKLTNEKTIYQKNYTFGDINILRKPFSDIYIIKIKYLDKEYTLKTLDKSLYDRDILNFLVFLNIFTLILIFSYIIKLLHPLKTITEKIKNFANGNLSTRINLNRDDEIGTLANSFNTMATSLENSIKVKEALLRGVGHELRTPITKGKYIILKIDNFSQKKLLEKIFSDLETIINRTIEFEKLNIIKPNISYFSVETLILESLSKLYLEDESKIQIGIKENFKIEADLYYLSIALKNIIDNALKYATSFPITIKVDKNEIAVLNKGEELSKDFEHYLEPFTQGLSSNDGFGLGLSIVKRVIDKHNFQLLYSYKDGFNIFKIIF